MRSSLVAATLTLAVACHHRGSDPATFDARTQHGEGAMRVTYFPATARANRRTIPVVVVEPVLLRREVLYGGPHGGLVAYLASEGFPVWLVWVDAPVPPDARALGAAVAGTLVSVARAMNVHSVDVLGVSMGAAATLHALEPLTLPGSPVAVRRVAFVGGGFDFAYPESFASRIASARGGPATAMCALEAGTGCARRFRKVDAVLPWLGAIPAADEDELRPARERFAFVARLGALPVLFVNGKADGIAPAESMSPVYSLWGSDSRDARTVPKWMFIAGRENGFGEDYDHFALLAGGEAEAEVWDHLAAWLKRE